jgi:hypothetical protein
MLNLQDYITHTGLFKKFKVDDLLFVAGLYLQLNLLILPHKPCSMKVSSIVIMLLLIISCQKELQEYEELSTSDCGEGSELVTEPVKFDDPNSGGDSASESVSDDHSGKLVCFMCSFNVPCDSCAYATKFMFKLYKSSGVTVDKAILYIDGIRSKVITPETSDTLVFNLVSPLQLTPGTPDSLYHTCAISIRGAGAAGEWYELKLIKALFENKNGCKIKTTRLPQWGPIATYE